MFSHHKKRKISLIVLLAFAGILIAGRLYLPVWLKGYVNDQIAALENYEGSVEDIDIHLWRGAYQIHGLEIVKQEGGIDRPFAAAETIDLSVEWRALFNGAVVAEIDIYDTDLNFAKTQTGEGAGWVKFVDALSPLDINRMELHSGKLTYTDYTAEPNINLYIEEIDAKVTNLRQVKDDDKELPSSLNISGNSMGGGKLNVNGMMNILKEIPDFDMGFELENASLPAFNDYTKNFAAIDFESGEIGIFGELAAANREVVGYVKPIVTDVNMVSIKQDKNPFNIIWESLTSFFIELFENQSEDQFAMRIPIEGTLDKTNEDMWSAFFSIFSNAFNEAFSKDEDGTINFEDALEKSAKPKTN